MHFVRDPVQREMFLIRPRLAVDGAARNRSTAVGDVQTNVMQGGATCVNIAGDGSSCLVACVMNTNVPLFTSVEINRTVEYNNYSFISI